MSDFTAKKGRLCPNCMEGVLSWDSDEEAEDIGYSEPGILSFYHCTACGAEIEVYVPDKANEKENDNE